MRANVIIFTFRFQKKLKINQLPLDTMGVHLA